MITYLSLLQKYTWRAAYMSEVTYKLRLIRVPMIWLGCCHNPLEEAQRMQRTETVSWLLGTVQRTWCPQLEACLAAPLTTQDQRLVTLLA